MIGGREKSFLPFEHQYGQNPETGSRAACSHPCSWDLSDGNPRLPDVARLPRWRSSSQDSSLSKYCDVTMKKTYYGFGWARKHLHTQRWTWSKLTFEYCSTLLLSNPNIVSAFIFCSSTFTHIQYYVIEENASEFDFILYIVYMYTCTIHLGFVKEIVTKGLWKSFLNW